ncbi:MULTISPECIES: hypothetical protein [unclassified Bartonella]|uniref:hypothetical protein n=1 Tax=unclassified Bartonella TaxID=2645622 RepID=UPI0035D0CE6E
MGTREWHDIAGYCAFRGFGKSVVKLGGDTVLLWGAGVQYSRGRGLWGLGAHRWGQGDLMQKSEIY